MVLAFILARCTDARRTGPGGAETADLVARAGLQNFQTFYERCAKALKSRDFQWSTGIESVNFGFDDPVMKP